MSKFRVGDKAKALVSTPWWREGDVGIIKRIDDGFRVDFEGEDGEIWWFCYAEESEFELVGPKVHITGGGSGGGAFAGGSGVTLGYGSSRLADNKLFHALKKDCIGEPPKHLSFGCVMNPTIKEYPNPPHIHKDLIIAWANGADIEVSSGDRVFCETSKPEWIDTLEYRIKPTKTPLQIEIEELEAKLVKLKGRL